MNKVAFYLGLRAILFYFILRSEWLLLYVSL